MLTLKTKTNYIKIPPVKAENIRMEDFREWSDGQEKKFQV